MNCKKKHALPEAEVELCHLRDGNVTNSGDEEAAHNDANVCETEKLVGVQPLAQQAEVSASKQDADTLRRGQRSWVRRFRSLFCNKGEPPPSDDVESHKVEKRVESDEEKFINSRFHAYTCAAFTGDGEPDDMCLCGRKGADHVREDRQPSMPANESVQHPELPSDSRPLSFPPKRVDVSVKEQFFQAGEILKCVRVGFDDKPEDVWTLLTKYWRLPVPKIVLGLLGAYGGIESKAFVLRAALTTDCWLIYVAAEGDLEIFTSFPTFIKEIGKEIEKEISFPNRNKNDRPRLNLVKICHWGTHKRLLRECFESEEWKQSVQHSVSEREGDGSEREAEFIDGTNCIVLVDDGAEKPSQTSLSFGAKMFDFIATRKLHMKSALERDVAPITAEVHEGQICHRTPIILFSFRWSWLTSVRIVDTDGRVLSIVKTSLFRDVVLKERLTVVTSPLTFLTNGYNWTIDEVVGTPTNSAQVDNASAEQIKVWDGSDDKKSEEEIWMSVLRQLLSSETRCANEDVVRFWFSQMYRCWSSAILEYSVCDRLIREFKNEDETVVSVVASAVHEGNPFITNSLIRFCAFYNGPMLLEMTLHKLYKRALTHRVQTNEENTLCSLFVTMCGCEESKVDDFIVNHNGFVRLLCELFERALQPEDFWKNKTTAPLFVWCILLNRREQASNVFKEIAEPIGAALVAAKLQRILSLHARKEHFVELAENLDRDSNAWETAACEMAKRFPPEFVQEMLVGEMNTFWQLDPLSIAASARCKKFMNLSCVRKTLNAVWRSEQAYPHADRDAVQGEPLFSPRTKFISQAVFWCLFVVLLGVLNLSRLPTPITYRLSSPAFIVELFVWLCGISLLLDEIRQICDNRAKTLKWKWKHHYRHNRFFQVLDVILIACLLSSIPVRLFCESHYWSKLPYALSIIFSCLRFMNFFYLFESVGPKVIMVQKMLKDLGFFMLLLIIFIVGFGVAMQALLYPRLCLSAENFIDALVKTYFQVFGDLSLDRFNNQRQQEGECSKEYLVENSSCAITSFSSNVSENTSSCNAFSYYPNIVLVGVYLMLTNILLVNLLIAMFSHTFAAVQMESQEVWRFHWYFIVLEYDQKRTPLHPPFVLLEHYFFLFLFLFWQIQKRCAPLIRRAPGHNDVGNTLPTTRPPSSRTTLRQAPRGFLSNSWLGKTSRKVWRILSDPSYAPSTQLRVKIIDDGRSAWEKRDDKPLFGGMNREVLLQHIRENIPADMDTLQQEMKEQRVCLREFREEWKSANDSIGQERSEEKIHSKSQFAHLNEKLVELQLAVDTLRRLQQPSSKITRKHSV